MKEFKVTFVVTTECTEMVDEVEVEKWVKQAFEGCDMGSISCVDALEIGVSD